MANTSINKNISSIGEFGLIDVIKSTIKTSKDCLVSIGDDTAVIKSHKSDLVLLTTDMLSEGVHFKSSDSALDVGYKALAVSISDIAAMGGKPTFALVSLGVSKTKKIGFVKDLYAGIRKCAKKFGVTIVGGDMIKSKQTVVNIALLGEALRGKYVVRSNAKLNDSIYVTGKLGGSLKSKRHLNFVPKVKEAQWLVKNLKINSMIDISDGLIADLGHILKQSNKGAMIFENDLPIHKNAGLNSALYDGEDFELLFTLNKRYENTLKKSKFPFYKIGIITLQRNKITLLEKDGKENDLKIKGFNHF